MPRLLTCLIAIMAFLLIAWQASPRAADTAPSPTPRPTKGLELQGVASCSTTGCHGGNGPLGARGSEYTTWMLHDPHAGAFDVLREEVSQNMERKFRGRGKEVRAESDSLCLSCHVKPNAQTDPHRPRFALADGVSCESCHGAAEKWLAPHTAWKDLGPAEKRRAYDDHAMVWLRDLGSRARACASCHVGTATADVNHDLIAAGHPRLNFEFSAYLRRMPHHWKEVADPGFEARAWAIGEVETARSALDLLAARAQPKDRPWPEFAEYDCASCHRELRERLRPAPRDLGGRAPGQLPWGPWYYTTLPAALAFRPSADNAATLESLEELRKLMRQSLPDAVKVAKHARGTADLLNRWLAGNSDTRFSDVELLRQTRAALMKEEQATPEDSDAALQRFLGMSALYRAERALKPDETDASFETYLERLGKQLRTRAASGRESQP